MAKGIQLVVIGPGKIRRAISFTGLLIGMALLEIGQTIAIWSTEFYIDGASFDLKEVDVEEV